jgi:MYXO-CTERM domain-containing protein
MRVRVTYDGVPFGEEHVIPVAIDAWAVGAQPTATGGCDCASARVPGGAVRGAWVLPVALGLAFSRRLRRRARRACGAGPRGSAAADR